MTEIQSVARGDVHAPDSRLTADQVAVARAARAAASIVSTGAGSPSTA